MEEKNESCIKNEGQLWMTFYCNCGVHLLTVKEAVTIGKIKQDARESFLLVFFSLYLFTDENILKVEN